MKSLFKSIFNFFCIIGFSVNVYATDGKLNKQNHKVSDIVKNELNNDFDHEHIELTEVLQKYVHVFNDGQYSQVDYKGLDLKKIDLYINKLLKIKKETVDSWSKNQQLSFYINLYNALTIKFVKNSYPIKSIKDLGGFLFGSPWEKKFFKIYGEEAYLDKLEHEFTRKNEKLFDPLVHFGFNCASIGCPALGSVAFSANTFEDQITHSAKMFLKDRSRNYYKDNTLYVSKIFDWYKTDFEKGVRGYQKIEDFFSEYAIYLSDKLRDQNLIKAKNFKIKYLPYDWSLNEWRTIEKK